MPKSFNYSLIHKIYAQYEVSAAYFALAADKLLNFVSRFHRKSVMIPRSVLSLKYFFDPPRIMHKKHRHSQLDKKCHLLCRRGPGPAFSSGISRFVFAAFKCDSFDDA